MDDAGDEAALADPDTSAFGAGSSSDEEEEEAGEGAAAADGKQRRQPSAAVPDRLQPQAADNTSELPARWNFTADDP